MKATLSGPAQAGEGALWASGGGRLELQPKALPFQVAHSASASPSSPCRDSERVTRGRRSCKEVGWESREKGQAEKAGRAKGEGGRGEAQKVRRGERGQEGERFPDTEKDPSWSRPNLSLQAEGVYFLEGLIPQKSLLQGPHQEERI